MSRALSSFFRSAIAAAAIFGSGPAAAQIALTTPPDLAVLDDASLFEWQGAPADAGNDRLYLRVQRVCDPGRIPDPGNCVGGSEIWSLTPSEVSASQAGGLPDRTRVLLFGNRGAVADWSVIACAAGFDAALPRRSQALDDAIAASCESSDVRTALISVRPPYLNHYQLRSGVLSSNETADAVFRPVDGFQSPALPLFCYVNGNDGGRPDRFEILLEPDVGSPLTIPVPAVHAATPEPAGTCDQQYDIVDGWACYDTGTYCVQPSTDPGWSQGTEVTWHLRPCVTLRIYDPACATPPNCPILEWDVCADPTHGPDDFSPYVGNRFFRGFTLTSGSSPQPPAPPEQAPSNQYNFGRTLLPTFRHERCTTCHLVNVDTASWEARSGAHVGFATEDARADAGNCAGCHAANLPALTDGAGDPIAQEWFAPHSGTGAVDSSLLIDSDPVAACEAFVAELQSLADGNGISLEEQAEEHFLHDPRVIWAVQENPVAVSRELGGAPPEDVAEWEQLVDEWIHQGAMSCAVDGLNVPPEAAPDPEEQEVDNGIPPVMSVHPRTGTFPDNRELPVVIDCRDIGSATAENPNGPRCASIWYQVVDGAPAGPPNGADFLPYTVPIRINAAAGEIKTLYYLGIDSSGNQSVLDQEVYTFELGDSVPPRAFVSIVYNPDEIDGRRYRLRFTCTDNAADCEVYFRRNTPPNTQTDTPFAPNRGVFLDHRVASSFRYRFFAVDANGNPPLDNNGDGVPDAEGRPIDPDLIEDVTFEVSRFMETDPPVVRATPPGIYRSPSEIDIVCLDEQHDCRVLHTWTSDGSEPPDPDGRAGLRFMRPILMDRRGTTYRVKAYAIDTTAHGNASEIVEYLYQTLPPEDCGDGADNDVDGAVDCDDADCLGDALCEEEQPTPTPGDEDDGGGTTGGCEDCGGSVARGGAGPAWWILAICGIAVVLRRRLGRAVNRGASDR